MLRAMPPGMTSVPGSIRRTHEEKLSLAQAAYDRAVEKLKLAEVELAGEIAKADTSDRHSIMVDTATAWVEECRRNKVQAKRKLEELKINAK
jgi:hypothetical protein